MMYTSIIRRHMEYACTVWDPHLAKDIKSIENTQKFALRVRNKTWDTSYKALLTASSLTTMASRRSLLKLCVLFNIINHYTIYPHPPFSRNAELFPSRHANKVQLSVPFARTNNLNSHISLQLSMLGTLWSLTVLQLTHLILLNVQY